MYVALSLYVPIQLGNATDLILGRGKVDFTEIGLIAVKIAAFTLIAAFAQWIMNNCNNKITYNVVRDIEKKHLNTYRNCHLNILIVILMEKQ